MSKTKIIPVSAFTKEDLQVRSIGFHHDHCRPLYFGLTDYLPTEYIKYSQIECKYIAIFEEDIPPSK